MLFGPAAVEDLSSEWTGVVRMRERMKLYVVASLAGGVLGGGGPPGIRVLYNLPLLLAFDVFKQVLSRARDEKLFDRPGKRPGLTRLMECGKDSLPWIDWCALREGVGRRNAVAHDGELFEGALCLDDISNVEAQLVAWEIIDAA